MPTKWCSNRKCNSNFSLLWLSLEQQKKRHYKVLTVGQNPACAMRQVHVGLWSCYKKGQKTSAMLSLHTCQIGQLIDSSSVQCWPSFLLLPVLRKSVAPGADLNSSGISVQQGRLNQGQKRLLWLQIFCPQIQRGCPSSAYDKVRKAR